MKAPRRFIDSELQRARYFSVVVLDDAGQLVARISPQYDYESIARAHLAEARMAQHHGGELYVLCETISKVVIA